jgi:hypothetical protein
LSEDELKIREEIWNLIGRTIQGEEPAEKSLRRTVFNELLESALPPEDKTQHRLAEEVQNTLAAGIETTAFALVVGTFHIVNTPVSIISCYAYMFEACGWGD